MNARQREVISLSNKGLTNGDIAATLEISIEAVRKTLSKAFSTALDETRAIMALNQELSRLDTLYGPFYELALEGDFRAAEICLKIADRRSKFLGLDAPEKLQVEQHGTLVSFLATLRERSERSSVESDTTMASGSGSVREGDDERDAGGVANGSAESHSQNGSSDDTERPRSGEVHVLGVGDYMVASDEVPGEGGVHGPDEPSVERRPVGGDKPVGKEDASTLGFTVHYKKHSDRDGGGRSGDIRSGEDVA